ncbi:restriction endonuclease subunit S [Streptococcus anginosus]|uniref:restriction endonuclease subunit S n=1 Tax=Streptococcus anginosus TaxID=1328 RepID=UPI0022E27028|nr:restriction endonuclease subunit S [Streptococcus anginosus]
MEKEKNKERIPQLRFPEFKNTPAWEQRKLGEVVSAEKKGKAKADMIGDESVYLDTEYLNGGQIVKVNAVKDTYLDDVIILWDGSQAGTLYYGFEGALGSTLKAYTISESSLFIYQQLKSRQQIIYEKYRTPNIPHVIKTFLDEFGVYIPSLPEQTAIGDFFSTLDRSIALHQRELENLKNRKKSLLQKMFPKNGESVPKIRFPEFKNAPAWEQRKLGEVAVSFSGGTPSIGNSKYYNGEIPFIRSAEINSAITELYLTEEGLKNSSAKMVNVGDILYALYGATSGEVGISKINGAINQAILAIKPYDAYNSKFIEQWLKNQKKNIIDKYLQGGQGNLSAAIVKKLLIPFPSLPEQTAIGDFFSTLDRSIALHQRKLEHLKLRKKALLQKMFP